MDEDRIPAYKCIHCNNNVCKDEVYELKTEKQCICLECGLHG